MTTRIRVTCPVCGHVLELRPHDVEVTALGPRPHVRDGSYYEFDCPDCGHVTKDANEHTVALLDSAGCCITWWNPPERADSAPPITYDELLDFHEAMQRPGWIRELTGKGAA